MTLFGLSTVNSISMTDIIRFVSGMIDTTWFIYSIIYTVKFVSSMIDLLWFMHSMNDAVMFVSSMTDTT